MTAWGKGAKTHLQGERDAQKELCCQSCCQNGCKTERGLKNWPAVLGYQQAASVKGKTHWGGPSLLSFYMESYWWNAVL